MSSFKCKMCGGLLEINNEMVAACEYCGTRQTIPKLSDDRRANLYDRANHFRRNNEFDKAMGIYEQILNEDLTDAESYWSLVLCRYGIEYVEDPVTRKRIPTVNRAQFTSIFDDDNYKSALQHADSIQRPIYEEEAKVINGIQKGILAISQKEEPFDVFICYKETDPYGRRTPDSVLANDLYHQLTQEGFKVFCARITLEDKLGSAYEPYIFAALNSAKVMVVLGTKPEFFKAAWVRNEWSRYLALIKQGQKKMLIPAYKDMDPYDLPEEFSHLQAQDMSKLGFMQDLIRGIKKIIQADTPKAAAVKETVISGGNASTAALLKRAFMFLEDGDWNSADEYCEKVLDMDPENPSAYLGKLMAELRVEKQENLRHCPKPFDHSKNYQKAVRFAEDPLKSELTGYIEYIRARNGNAAAGTEAERAPKEKKRGNWVAVMTGIALCALIALAILLSSVIKRSNQYNDAIALMDAGEYTDAIAAFEALDGYKDSADKISQCNTYILDGKYDDAVALMNAGKYTDAIAAFEALGGYKDSADKISRCNTCILDGKYDDAVALMNAGKYTEAIAAFEALGGYKDSADKISRCNTHILDGKYDDAVALMNAGKYADAIAAFEALGGYKDSAEKIKIIYERYEAETLKAVKAGDYVFFGAYEQDNITFNGKEAVEWLVLDVKDGKALLISKYALDSRDYNISFINSSWETCSLRKWLNGEFLRAAFSTSEQAMIRTVTVPAHKNPDYNTDPGNPTEDKVFLLSIPEAYQYFSSNSVRQCKPTAYAVANGAYVNGAGNCWWWLRSPGDVLDGASVVAGGGNVNSSGNYVDDGSSTVRPALWVDLNVLK